MLFIAHSKVLKYQKQLKARKSPNHLILLFNILLLIIYLPPGGRKNIPFYASFQWIVYRIFLKCKNVFGFSELIISWLIVSQRQCIYVTDCCYGTAKNCTVEDFVMLSLWHTIQLTYTHIHTHPFNGPFSGTTRVSRYQKGNTNLYYCEARDSEWQWHQLGHMQFSTSLQTDNHASTPLLSFLQAGYPSCHPTNSVKALKALYSVNLLHNSAARDQAADVAVSMCVFRRLQRSALLTNLLARDLLELLATVNRQKDVAL